jgi:hypothetical protein
MNPEERAREIFKYRFVTDWGHEDPSGKKREMFVGNLIQDIARALREQIEKDAGILEEAFGECDTYNLLHGAARIRGQL